VGAVNKFLLDASDVLVTVFPKSGVHRADVITHGKER
jgi:hypothetical protein